MPKKLSTLTHCLALAALFMSACQPAPATLVPPSPTEASTVTDVDGNVYHTVTIGTQTWMKENLKTTRYSNGDAIGTTSPAMLDISNENTPKYQWAYDGDESNVAVYGRLYTWYAVTDSRNVCPAVWHVPTEAEWTTLVDYLGGDVAARGKLKETGTTHWNSPNTDATNESGFAALPAGTRWIDVFKHIGMYTHFWSSTELRSDKSFAWRTQLNFDTDGYECCHAYKWVGFSVRCLKD